MLAAVFQRPGQMEVTEVDTPEIGADEVLVKVGANTICGTDVRIFRGEKTKGISPPFSPFPSWPEAYDSKRRCASRSH